MKSLVGLGPVMVGQRKQAGVQAGRTINLQTGSGNKGRAFRQKKTNAGTHLGLGGHPLERHQIRKS